MPSLLLPWLELPLDVWVLIMSSMTISHRMTSSLACSKLREAAAQATQDLLLTMVEHEVADSLDLWLMNHGQYVSSLCIATHSKLLQQLPCPLLQQLVLSMASLQLGPSSTKTGLLQACTGLTQLSLLHCIVRDESRSLSLLTTLSALQCLELHWLTATPRQAARELELPCCVLQHLTKLTSLGLSGDFVEQHSLQHLGSLLHLQQLSLAGAVTVSPTSMPGFSELTALRRLNLTQCPLDPTVLRSSSGLQQLQLKEISMVPAATGSLLLSCVAGLQQLQDLNLDSIEMEWPAAAAAYSALAASSTLTALHLQGCPLPSGAWEAIFPGAGSPGGRSLPHLQRIVLPAGDFDQELSSDSDDEADFMRPHCALSTADLSRLVSCCPGLQDCTLCVQPNVQLSALAELTALAGLRVKGISDTTFESLSLLTRLSRLRVTPAEAIQPQSFLGLTELRRLLELWVDCDYAQRLDQTVDWEQYGVMIYSASLEAPGVWSQLLQHCTGISECQPLLLQNLILQVTEHHNYITGMARQHHYIMGRLGKLAHDEPIHQAQHSQQAQQQAQLQTQVALLQEQNIQLQQQMRDLQQQQQKLQQQQQQQQQSAGERGAAEVVELRGRVGVLEGQVQQLLEALQHTAGRT